MEHPQPAFDFLTALPVNPPVEDIMFCDWYAHEDIDGKKKDRIVNHPEAWEVLELPSSLAELSSDNYVSLQPMNGLLNLNAIAIGLGLENVQFSPKQFYAAVYDPKDHDSIAILPPNTLIFTIGETPEDASKLVDLSIDRLEQLELLEKTSFDAERQTRQVSEFL